MELTKKMLRDMRNNKWQFLSILIIALLGVFAFSGLDSVRTGIKKDSDKFFSDTNIADSWIYVKNVNADDINKVNAIDNVSSVQERLTFAAKDGNNDLRLLVTGENKISKPFFVEGEDFNKESEGIWLDREYASQNEYYVGDYIQILNSKIQIKGIILSSEEIYNPMRGESLTDHSTSGYAYISQKQFIGLTGKYQPSELLIKYADNSNLNQTIKDIENVLGDKFITYTERKEQQSVNHIKYRVDQLEKFTFIFSGIFFLLAVLTLWVTMTRLITGQRIQIGTLMALGYSKSHIIFHYVNYGLWVGLIGGIIGILLGCYIIPTVLISTMSKFTMMPYWNTNITIGGIIALIIMCCCCVLAALISCLCKLRVMPAQVLRGSEQRIGRHSFIEHSKNIWYRLSISSRSSVRNICRNRVRSIMGIVGIMGSTVLLLAGLGMKDSLNNTVKYTYEDFYQYSTLAELSDSKVGNMLQDMKDCQLIEKINIEVMSDSEKKNATLTVYDKGSLISICDNKEGIQLTNELCTSLDVEYGDTIKWRVIGTGKWNDYPIEDTVESPLPKMLFIDRKSWEKLGLIFEPNEIYTTQDKTAFTNLDGILSIEEKENQESSMQDTFDNTSSIIYILIVAAVLLAVVVIASLGLLNYEEMLREYATLKVIGLYPGEIRNMSFRENLILTLAGWLLGLPIAKWFTWLFMNLLSNESVTCMTHITTRSYIVSSAVVILCSLGVNLLLSIKINKIDMVISLKSNE